MSVTHDTPNPIQNLKTSYMLKELGSGGSGGCCNNPDLTAGWKLIDSAPSTGEYQVDDVVDDELEGDDDEILDSEGSSVTVLDQLEPPNSRTTPLGVEFALLETPPEKLRKMRKAPVDCHALNCWSSLVKLVKENMTCAKCGNAINKFERRTIGIATELDF
jgi:hypothetical protein